MSDTLDNIILELAHKASMIQRGKTISADTFPEAKLRIQKAIRECMPEKVMHGIGHSPEYLAEAKARNSVIDEIEANLRRKGLI